MMSEFRQDSKTTTAGKEQPEYAYARVEESLTRRGYQGKRAKKRKREKSSWKNGGFGAVNPKLARGFLKTTQLSTFSGKRIKIQAIPFFRAYEQQFPEVEKKGLKPALVASTVAAAKRLLSHSAAEPQSYDLGRGTCIELIPFEAKRESVVPVLPVSCSDPPPRITAVLQRNYRSSELVLKDPRMNMNAQDADGRTALYLKQIMSGSHSEEKETIIHNYLNFLYNFFDSSMIIS
jgi:hypothetical protein